MESTSKALTSRPPSKLRIVLMWGLLAGSILFWVVFWVWYNHGRGRAPATGDEAAGNESAHRLVASVLYLFFGGFFLVGGVGIYVAAIFSGCFSFSYARPVWQGVKVRKYFLNIIVTVLLGLGLGFMLSAFVSPMLSMMGLDPGLAAIAPVMLMVGGIQMVQLWVLIWSPMERRLIVHRLAALGIQAGQLQNAFLAGLSDPASGIAKRFASIEEDLGALWVGPEQLIYWGDSEQFSIQRGQIVEVERRADNRSTTVLAGIQHVILHVRLPDGSVRQMRLHVEGQMTMGQKRRKMDELGEAINQWMSR
jgi:hypothetical protein